MKRGPFSHVVYDLGVGTNGIVAEERKECQEGAFARLFQGQVQEW